MNDIIKVIDTDTFSVWKDKFNTLVDFITDEYIDYKNDLTLVELSTVIIDENNLWKIKAPFLHKNIRLEIDITYKELIGNTNQRLIYGKEWYFTNDGLITLNTPLIPGDKLSIKAYNDDYSKKFNEIYQKHIPYVLNEYNTTFDSVNNTTTLNVGHVFDKNSTYVIINNQFAFGNYDIQTGFVTFNSILNLNDNVVMVYSDSWANMNKYTKTAKSSEYDNYQEADVVKNIIDSKPYILYKWELETNGNENEPSLTELEYTSRSIQTS